MQISKPIKDWISDNKTVCIHKKYTYTIQWRQQTKRVRSYTNIRVSQLVQDCISQFKLSHKPISMYILRTTDGRTLESASTLPFYGMSTVLYLTSVDSVEISVKEENIPILVKVNPFDTVRELVRVGIEKDK